MDTGARLILVDGLLKRARELMGEAEKDLTDSQEVPPGPRHRVNQIPKRVMMADTYGRIAQGYLESVKVRKL